jgi:hypothetical protein
MAPAVDAAVVGVRRVETVLSEPGFHHFCEMRLEQVIVNETLVSFAEWGTGQSGIFVPNVP